MQRLLVGADIMRLISELSPPLVQDYVYIRQQLQPAGFDLSVGGIFTYPNHNIRTHEFSKAKTYFNSDLVEHPFGELLLPLRPYILRSIETVNMPLDITAVTIGRSSLARIGCLSHPSLVDAGYRGQLNFLVTPLVPTRFKRGDRVAQAIFIQHDMTFAYTGQYQSVLGKDAKH